MPFGKLKEIFRFQKKVNVFLRLANILLIVVSWILAVYAYPRLPQEVPFSLRAFGHEIIESHKSLWFFLYPAVQTIFVIVFLWRAKGRPLGTRPPGNPAPGDNGTEEALLDLRREWLLLTLIFINLIFIHLQTSLILLSHHIGRGVNEFYFFSLIAIFLVLIPYYRVRRSLITRGRR